MWVEFDHFSKLLGCRFPSYWCCSSVKQDKQAIKSKGRSQKQKQIKVNINITDNAQQGTNGMLQALILMRRPANIS